MARNFIGKVLKFANHLAADYYSRGQSRSGSEGKDKKKQKGISESADKSHAEG